MERNVSQSSQRSGTVGPDGTWQAFVGRGHRTPNKRHHLAGQGRGGKPATRDGLACFLIAFITPIARPKASSIWLSSCSSAQRQSFRAGAGSNAEASCRRGGRQPDHPVSPETVSKRRRRIRQPALSGQPDGWLQHLDVCTAPHSRNGSTTVPAQRSVHRSFQTPAASCAAPLPAPDDHVSALAALPEAPSHQRSLSDRHVDSA